MSLRRALPMLAICLCTGPLLSTKPAAAQEQTASLAVVPCDDKAWKKGDAPPPADLSGARLLRGDYEGGQYRIEIPDNWNGELVLFAHGYQDAGAADGLQLKVPDMPIRQYLITSGFAWAASSYRCNGYIPGQGLLDTMALKDVFLRLNDGHAPRRVYLIGISMGGHAALVGAQQMPTAVDGTLAMCAAGPALFDYFTSAGAAAETISGLHSTSASVADDGKAMDTMFGKPPSYTDKGLQLASVEIQLSGGPRPFAAEGLRDVFAVNYKLGLDALVNLTTPWHRIASDTATVFRIDDGLGLNAETLNAQVRRKPADATLATASGKYRDAVPFDGRIERPLLTMHTTGDLYVPIALERTLKRAVTAAGRDDRLVQRIYRAAGHCTFTTAETRAAFDALVTWVRAGTKPAGDDVMSDLADAGRQFTTPVRQGDPGTLTIRK